MEEKFDVVYTWVDGESSKFRNEMAACIHGKTGAEEYSFQPRLFRDNGELRYSLRSLEEFAPWIRNVFIVTNGECPQWLNLSNDRVSVIPHELIFKEQSDLPTFNAYAIEAHIHKIPNLSRRFLYFNDDFFLGRPMLREDFITPSDGQYVYVDHALPKLIPEEWVDDRAQAYTRSLIRGICDRPISRMMPAHVPHLFDREILFRLEKLFPEQLRETSAHKFRSPNNVSIPTLYSLYVSEVLGQREGHQRRFLAPLAFNGLHDYAMVMLDEQVWKMMTFMCAIRLFRPKFFSINDRLGEVSSYHLSLICFRGFLRTYFPNRCSFEN